MMPTAKTVIAICGPTASGKTGLAMELAGRLKAPILSADSRQCFKELNIGVAKPMAKQLREIHHYFINSHSIQDRINAASFENIALEAAEEVFKVHDFLILAGGTGLYVKAFLEGLDDIPGIDMHVEKTVREGFEMYGRDWLSQQLRAEDHLYARDGEMQNPHRMMRALTVKRSTGKSILTFYSSGRKVRNFKVKKIFIDLPRKVLYERIDARTDQMMKDGLLEEAKQFFSRRHLNALQTVGYQELFDYLSGKVTLEKAVELIKRNTRHYAKRQLTWFKKYFVDENTEVLKRVDANIQFPI